MAEISLGHKKCDLNDHKKAETKFVSGNLVNGDLNLIENIHFLQICALF